MLAKFGVVVAAALMALSQGEQSGEKRLIEFGRNARVWLSQDQIEAVDEHREKVKELGLGYFDVTDFQEEINVPIQKAMEFPTKPSFQSIVNPLIAESSASNLRSYVATMASFTNRYYTTPDGVESAIWIKDTMEGFIVDSGRKDAYCTLFNHTTYPQPSVVCSIMGSSDVNEVVVTGAHLDSINSRASTGRAPGADDDATGVASFMEGFRILLNSGFKPKRSIDFIGYAAEEVGLRGSQDIARNYRSRSVPVYAVYQNEMSGYKGKSPAVTVLQDFVDSDLTLFMESLIPEYLNIPLKRAVCGYGCSDHASWDKEGFSAVCTAEAGPFGEVNPNMHTDKDTVDNLDFDFTNEFSKLNIAFIVELSLYGL